MVFWFRGSPSIFISMETTAAFGVDDSRSSLGAWKLESSKVSLEWGNFEVFQKTLRGEKLDVFGKLSKAMQISPDNPSLGRVFQMRTLMCSSKASMCCQPNTHLFGTKKVKLGRTGFTWPLVVFVWIYFLRTLFQTSQDILDQIQRFIP